MDILNFVFMSVFAQETVIVRPREIDDVLINPGIGFMTFQRFNGDALNPGNLYDDAVLLPSDMPLGEYDLQIAILDTASNQPKVKLAISGKQSDDWYHLGKIKVQN
ncbi:MAG: hypothetical protein ACE5PV_00810 [Candidatus Poribacteria bacterium]